MLEQAYPWMAGAAWRQRPRHPPQAAPGHFALRWLAWWSHWRARFRKNKLPGPSAADRRESFRYGISLETSVRLMAAVEGDNTPVRVRNISAGGISLVINRGVDPDTLLNVELLNRPNMFLCKVQVRVTYVVEHPTGDWIIGGAFVRKLSHEELRSLLS